MGHKTQETVDALAIDKSPQLTSAINMQRHLVIFGMLGRLQHAYGLDRYCEALNPDVAAVTLITLITPELLSKELLV